MNRPDRLGWIVAALGLAQLGLYVASYLGGRDVAFYFDPRIGLFALQSMLGPEPESLGLLQWAAVLWQLGIGWCLLTNRASVLAYLVGEALLATPSLLFFALVIASNMSPSHGFSIAELLVPVPVFALFSVWPFVVALRLHRATKGAKGHDRTASRRRSR
jgi:hypothetical protein